MTTVDTFAPHTASDLLFGHGAGTQGELARQMTSAHADHALRRLPRPTREAAVLEAAAAASGLLNGDLIGMLVGGWRKQHDLVDAARHTLAAPTITKLVDLVDHQITTTEQLSVAVLVDGRQVTTIQLSLSVEFDIGALVAAVKAGRLVAFHAGHCDVTATLAIQGADVLTRHAKFDLPGVVPVKPGIRLLPAEDYLADEEANAPTLPMKTPPASGAVPPAGLPRQPGTAVAGAAPLPRWWS
jgi:hypothetical protein